MQKLLYLSSLLIIASIALSGCVDSTVSEGDTSPTNGQENMTQARDEPAESEPAASATTDVDSDTPAEAIPSHTLIQLSDPLDEPEYYCIDVPGFRQSLDLDGALTAHTCKPNADDEMFTINHPAEGQIYMPAYERCMEARSAESGAELSMSVCSDSPLQRFAYHDDGTIQLQSNEATALCITVADEAGEPTGGPSHLRRDLMLLPCTDGASALSQWTFPGPTAP